MRAQQVPWPGHRVVVAAAYLTLFEQFLFLFTDGPLNKQFQLANASLLETLK